MTTCNCGKMKVGQGYTGADMMGRKVGFLSRDGNIAFTMDGFPAHYCRDAAGKKLATWEEEFE